MMATFDRKYLGYPVWFLWVMWWSSVLCPSRFAWGFEWQKIGAAIEEKTARARRS